MSTLTATAVQINLEAACHDQGCSKMADERYAQLATPRYSRAAAILAMPSSVAQWRAEHRTARKRADRAQRLGYTFAEINRAEHSDAINEINTSLPVRQGRPMTDGYTRPRRHGALPAYACPRHSIHSYGVLDSGGTLRAYLTLHRCGELALVSMILGHGEHQDAGIMYLQFQGVVERQAGTGGFFYYLTWDSGQEGLRFTKARYGFGPADVAWLL